MLRTAMVVLLSVAHVAAIGPRSQAGEGNYFRRDCGIAGPNNVPLCEQFDKEHLLWLCPLAPGHSTPCVTEELILLTTFQEDQQELATVAINSATGDVVWRREAPVQRIEPFHSVGSPAASTIASDSERAYVFFGSCGLLCYNLDGERLWHKRMGPFQNEFGASSSPIIVDDKVILNQDHDINSFIIAVDRETGDTVWKVDRNGFTRSFSTPILVPNEDQPRIVVGGSLQLTAYDAVNGKIVWWVRGLSRIVDTTPVVHDGRIFLATWTPGGDPASRISMEPFADALRKYDQNDDGQVARSELPDGPVRQRFFRIDLNQDQALSEQEWNQHATIFSRAQNVAMAIRTGGRGDVTNSHVEWIQRQGLPTVPSPLVVDGVMFMVKDSGILTSLDVATGKVIKQGRLPGRGNYYASLVAGDGKVYAASERGTISVVRAAGKWRTLAHHDFEERIMATPVIHDGRIYVRTEDALYCFAEH